VFLERDLFHQRVKDICHVVAIRILLLRDFEHAIYFIDEALDLGARSKGCRRHLRFATGS
jgi:hypothetical protein